MSAVDYVDYIYLHYVLSDEFDDSAAGRWIPAEEMRELFQGAMREAFRARGYLVGSRYENVVDGYIRKLWDERILVQDGDEYTGHHLRFDRDAKTNLVKLYLTDHPVAKQIDRLGGEALDKALATLARTEGWQEVSPPQDERGPGNADAPPIDDASTASSEEIPASDRLVKLSDNQPEVVKIRRGLAELRQKIARGNDLGDLSPEEVEVAATEVEQLEGMLAKPVVRAGTIADMSRRTLKWIGEKAAGAAIGKAAIAVLTAIAALFGFSL